MARLEISEAHVSDSRVGDGVLFTATSGATKQRFLVSREALMDLEGAREDVDLMPLFEKHKDRVANAADKAIAYGYEANEMGWYILDTKMFG